MEPRVTATRVPDPDAVEFIRFCYQRRRVGWPELYDEMCAVAARGLFRGLGTEDLAAHGIGFSLFDTPALAAAASLVVAEEQAHRRRVTVVITPATEVYPIEAEAEGAAEPIETFVVPIVQPVRVVVPKGEPAVRFAMVPAGA
jgi:hypothetical protein